LIKSEIELIICGGELSQALFGLVRSFVVSNNSFSLVLRIRALLQQGERPKGQLGSGGARVLSWILSVVSFCLKWRLEFVELNWNGLFEATKGRAGSNSVLSGLI